MMQSRAVEIWVGLFVMAGLAALFVLAMKVSNLSKFANGEGYEIQAAFDNIGGLKVRSPVAVAGVRIGRVVGIQYDEQTFEAVVTMRVESQYDKLPEDTSAAILTSGLLGEQYVGLEPGGSMTNLKHGDRLRITQSAVILEQLIGQLLFSKAAEGESK